MCGSLELGVSTLDILRNLYKSISKYRKAQRKVAKRCFARCFFSRPTTKYLSCQVVQTPEAGWSSMTWRDFYLFHSPESVKCKVRANGSIAWTTDVYHYENKNIFKSFACSWALYYNTFLLPNPVTLLFSISFLWVFVFDHFTRSFIISSLNNFRKLAQKPELN